MNRVSLGRFKCRVKVEKNTRATDLFPRGLRHVARWEDREVEIFVDAGAIAKWHGSDAHNSPKGKVQLGFPGLFVDVVAVK